MFPDSSLLHHETSPGLLVIHTDCMHLGRWGVGELVLVPLCNRTMVCVISYVVSPFRSCSSLYPHCLALCLGYSRCSTSTQHVSEWTHEC